MHVGTRLYSVRRPERSSTGDKAFLSSGVDLCDIRDKALISSCAIVEWDGARGRQLVVRDSERKG